MKKKLLKCLSLRHILFSTLFLKPMLMLLIVSLNASQVQADIVRKGEIVTLSFKNAFQITVRGTVTSEIGDLPGVNIVQKGTTNGTTTDGDGKYSLVVPEGDAVLVFSFIGYATQEVAVNGRSVIDVTLVEDVRSLEEVIVTGYSSERKKDITGSVSVVDMKGLKAFPAGSALQALQGQASGVNVISSGAPGGRSLVFIRGVTSFGNNRPLILVDGIQTEIDNVMAEDIESMQVLKDAGASAIYGVRGANGVIVITTKKGKTGQPVFSYNSYVGVQLPLPGNPFNLLNGEDYARLTKIANPSTQLFANGLPPDYLYRGPGVSGIASDGDPAVDPSKYNLDPVNPANNYLIQKANKSGTNWFQEVFDPAPITSHNITTSGGSDKAKYMVSLIYFNQQGTLLDTHIKRYSARVNTEFKLGKNIRIGENVYMFNRQNMGYANLLENQAIQGVIRMNPIIPVYDIKGNFGGTFGGPELGDADNPVAQQTRTSNNRNNSWDVVGNVYAEVDFLKNFTVRTSFGGNINNNYNVSFAFSPYNNAVGSANPNSLSESSGHNSNIMWTNTIDYNNSFGKHNIKILAGSEAIQNNGRTVGGGRTRFYSTDFDYLLLGNGAGIITNFSSAYKNTLFSYYGRLDYSFNDRYLLSATIRRDGSSVFGPESRYGVFPSVSLGWRLTEENFMSGITWLNDLKLRTSYGVLGSQNNVNPFNAFTLFGGNFATAFYDIRGTSNSVVQGLHQTRIGNPSTGWEENIMTNIGLDATLFNKLDFNIEYYQKSIKGLLFPQPVPATVGIVAPPVVNIGDIRNAGFDIAVNYRGSFGKNASFNIGTNITTYRNEVMDIPGPGYFDTGFSRIGNLVRNQEGHPVSSFFGYDVVGLFQSNEDVAKSPGQDGAQPGRFKYRDANNDGVITPDDRILFGDPNPDFTYGLNLGLNYGNFDLSTIFYGSQGNQILNNVRWWTDFYSTFTGAKSNVLLNAWTPENTNTNIPKIEAASSLSNSGTNNSYYMEDGSYLRLRSIIIGYTLNPASLRKFGISSLRLYVQAANLFTITNYSGLDPELGGSSSVFGVDFGNYPNNEKNFLFGLNLNF